MKISVNINSFSLSEKIAGSDTRNFLCGELVRYMDKFVPKGDTGQLASNVTIENDGREIVYHAPYAHYQHEGKVLTDELGRTWVSRGESKPIDSGRALKHSNGVSKWDDAALSTYKDAVVRSVGQYIKRKLGG